MNKDEIRRKHPAMSPKTRGANTVAYIRTSTDKQEISPEAQRAKIESYAKTYDLELVDVIVETQSAKSLDRPGLQRTLGMLKDGTASALLVFKLDRLTRSVADLGRLLEEYFASGECALLSVSEQIDTRTAGGRLVLNVLASVSQWEREVIGERTSAALQHKARNGEYIGGRIPYGRKLGADGKRLEADPSELAAMQRARELRSEGKPLRAIADELARWGFKGREGKRLGPSSVLRLLRHAA
jgi:DNA invertase Pin-like site-specific DNA recombinase